MPVEKFEKPPVSEEKTIGNEEFAKWLGRSYQIQMSIAIRKTLDLSQKERKLMMKVKEEIPEITREELDSLKNVKLDRILENIKTLKDNKLNPHDYVQILGAYPPNVKGNVENLVRRELKVRSFISILSCNPKFVEEDMKELDGRNIDVAHFEAKSKIGINPKRFVEFLDTPIRERVQYRSLNNKRDFKESINNLGATDEQQALAKILGEMERREREGKGEMSNDEMWEIFRTYSTSSRIRMNRILLTFVEDGGLKESGERSVEKRRY